MIITPLGNQYAVLECYELFLRIEENAIEEVETVIERCKKAFLRCKEFDFKNFEKKFPTFFGRILSHTPLTKACEDIKRIEIVKKLVKEGFTIEHLNFDMLLSNLAYSDTPIENPIIKFLWDEFKYNFGVSLIEANFMDNGIKYEADPEKKSSEIKLEISLKISQLSLSILEGFTIRPLAIIIHEYAYGPISRH